VIPVLDELEHLEPVVEAILGQRYEGSLEFLFLDGGSTDGTLEALEQLAERDDRMRVLDNPRRSTPGALNLGLEAARGEFLVRMDAHTLYPRDYIATGIARLKRGDVVSVSGPQLAVGEGRWSRRVALALASPLGVGGAGFRRTAEAEFEVDSGFTGIWRRETLLAAGGWDENWVGDEDVELAARLRRNGGRIVCIPAMAAQYAPRDSLAALAEQYWIYGRARVRTSLRHPQSLRPSQVLPPALAVTLATALLGPRALARPARAGVVAYVAALAVESARAAARGSAATDAAALPAVFATMHLAYGAGALAGCATHGVPVEGLAHAAGRLAERVVGSNGSAPAAAAVGASWSAEAEPVAGSNGSA